MGMTLKPVGFWVSNFKVGEVISATHLAWFHIKSLKRFASRPASLYQVQEDGSYYLTLENNEFIHFKQAERAAPTGGNYAD